ncbi:MAG TPA: DHA2 family efflux MFS transporter permease subunit [Noviherbaspirillum sp.]
MSAASSAAPRAASPPLEHTDLKTWIAVLASMMGAFIAILDIQITNSSLKDILGTLSATQEEGSWVSTSYLVAEVIIIPMTGLLARVFGVRNYIIATTTAFLLISSLCGMAWNLPSMIVLRALQGLAGGGLIPMAMTLVMTQLPPTKRAVGMALFGLTGTMAPVLGITFGGYLSQSYGWPAIFYVNWIPGILLIAGIAYGLAPVNPQLERLWHADWFGIAFMALGLGSLTVFLEEGNLKDWFDSSLINICAALACIGLLGWVLNNHFQKDPFVNLSLYGRRNFLVAAVLSAVSGIALYGSSFLIPLFLSQIANYTPMQIGQVIMWAGLPQLLVMPIVTALAPRVDNRILCSIGFGLFGVSCLMNSTMDASTGYDQLLVSQVVRALGQPFIMLIIANFAMKGVAPHETASASALFSMTRNLGGSMGIAILATVLTKREHFHSARLVESVTLASPETQLRIGQITRTLLARGEDPWPIADDRIARIIDTYARKDAYVMAYNDCFWIIGLILLGCIGIVWFADAHKTPAKPKPVAVSASK